MRKEALYQVMVENRDGEVVAVGPRIIKPVAEEILVTINALISAGKEKDWSNPHIVPVIT